MYKKYKLILLLTVNIVFRSRDVNEFVKWAIYSNSTTYLWQCSLQNPTSYLHFEVIDRYLQRMRIKTLPDEAPLSLDSFYFAWVAGITLLQSRCRGFAIQIWKCCSIAHAVMVIPRRLFVVQNDACHPRRLQSHRHTNINDIQLFRCRSTIS